MYQDVETNQRIPIIFPSTLVHAEIDMALRNLGLFRRSMPISAGELSIVDSEINCHGESTTMGLTALSTDTECIRMHDYFFGM